MTHQVLIELLATYPKNASVFRVRSKKSDGGFRVITKPNKQLGSWLKQVNKVLNELYPSWPDYIHGKKRHSYVTFAKAHVGQSVVITIDIKNCFPSVSQSKVAASLENRLQLERSVAIALASKLCERGEVPQGFSTSNFLSNLALLESFEKLDALTQGHGLKFTNYVDDIAISGEITDPGQIINEVALILSRAGFSLKKAKIKVMPSNTKQIICGLIVNERVSLTKQKKKSLVSAILNSDMSKESARGWIANTKGFDAKFSNKLSMTLEKAMTNSKGASNR